LICILYGLGNCTFTASKLLTEIILCKGIIRETTYDLIPRISDKIITVREWAVIGFVIKIIVSYGDLKSPKTSAYQQNLQQQTSKHKKHPKKSIKILQQTVT